MSKCGSYALLFALSLIGFSIGFSGSASAASPYDDFVISDTLEVSDGVDTFDISHNFTSIVLDDDDVDSNIKTSLLNAINSEIGGWSVTQASEPSGKKYVIYKWNTDRNDIITSFKMSQPLYNYLDAYGQDGFCIIQYSQFGAVPNCELSGGYTHEIVSTPLNNNPDYYFGAFIINYDIAYPPDYEGPLLPDTAPGIDSKDTIRPDFKYTIVDKQISLSDHNQALPEFIPEEGYNMVEYLVEWTVTKCEGHDPDEDFEQQGLCTGSEYVTSERLPQSDTFEYEVAEYGNYQLRAQYLVEMCHRYPSYPTTPDYCFYVEVGTQYEAYDWGETTKNVTIDGRTIIGDTDLESCDEFNICTRPSQDSVISNYFQDKNASGLMMFLQAPIVFYQSLPAMTQSCTPITVPFLGGRTFELECLRPRYQQLSPFIYTMFQTVINGVVAYAVATKIFARIKNVNDPENDRIEVARL